MCKVIQEDEIETGIGYFQKGNEPSPMKFPIKFAPCECGERWYGFYEGNTVWIELERV